METPGARAGCYVSSDLKGGGQLANDQGPGTLRVPAVLRVKSKAGN
jgi:hypothetical protein